MNFAEALLAADAAKMTKKDTKDYEVPRLSKLLGFPFVLHLTRLPFKRVREIQDNATVYDKQGRPQADNYKLFMGLLCDGVSNPEFSNPEVLKHYNCATKKDLFLKLLKPGEIQEAAQAMSDLCGFGADSIEEKAEVVKN